MSHFAGRLWWVAVPVLAFAAFAALLNGNAAIAIMIAALLGIVLATPRYSLVLAAVLIAPLALLALILSITGSLPGTLGSVSPLQGDAAAAFPLGLLIGGGAVSSLIPYAAARWTHHGVLAALLAWICGALVTAAAGNMALSALYQRLPDAPLVEPAQAAQVRAMNAALWSTYSSSAVYFQYDGQVGMPVCNGLHSHSYIMQISSAARDNVARFVDGPFKERLEHWFRDSDDGDFRIPCTTAVSETAGGTTEVTQKCEPTEQLRTFLERHPATGFDASLPTVHFQAPLLVPGTGSIMTITAPSGCIADTFPRATSREGDGATETLRLPVGFPRQNFPLTEAQRLWSEPWIVHVYLLRPALRGSFSGAVLRLLDKGWSMTILLLAVVLAGRGLTLAVARAIAGSARGSATIAGIRDRLKPARDTLAGLDAWYARRSRLFRLLLIGALILLALPVLLVLVASLLDPTYIIAVTLVVVILLAIEIIAFVLRHIRPAAPPRVPDAAPGA